MDVVQKEESSRIYIIFTKLKEEWNIVQPFTFAPDDNNLCI